MYMNTSGLRIHINSFNRIPERVHPAAFRGIGADQKIVEIGVEDQFFIRQLHRSLRGGRGEKRRGEKRRNRAVNPMVVCMISFSLF